MSPWPFGLLVAVLLATTEMPRVAAEFSIDDATLFRINFNPADDALGRKGDEGIAATADGTQAQPVQKPVSWTEEVASPAPTLVQKQPDEEHGDGIEAGAQDEASGDNLPPAYDEIDADSSATTVVMTSTNQERYVCTLPKPRPSAASQKDEYDGPNALEILQKLFISQSCAFRLEHYWTYELCHGRYIRQFHEERVAKGSTETKVTEYFLGKYDSDTFQQDLTALRSQLQEGQASKPQKKRIETMNMPYYELMMTDGTVCDLNGQPRVTRVLYVCYPAGKNEIYSLKESSTCEYEILVLSPTLCAHPDYRPEESNELDIDCKPLDQTSPQKPASLVQLEEESLRLRTANRMFEGDFMPGDKPGSVRIEIKPVNPTGESAVGGNVEDDEALEDEAAQHKEENWPSRDSAERRQPFKPLNDPEVVREFLMGEFCLYGGGGWWKYEFCYGKRVNQYHEERGGKRTVINLGLFDEQAHLQWLDENPTKRPKKPGIRKHVSHFYSGGDVCDITGKPRQVEVKLKCMKKADSPSTVSLYLLEPKTCQYILGVESPLVCDILDQADDETGLIWVDRSSFESLPSLTPSTEPGGDDPVALDDEQGPNPPPPRPVQPPPKREDVEHREAHLREHVDRASEAAVDALMQAAGAAGVSDEEKRQVREQAEKLKEQIAQMIEAEEAKARMGSDEADKAAQGKKSQEEQEDKQPPK